MDRSVRIYIDIFILNTNDSFLAHYVLQCRLRWGEPDTQCLLDQDPPVYRDSPDFDPSYCLPPLPDDAPALFTLDIPKRLISIMRNDWPYSGRWHDCKSFQIRNLNPPVPLFVEHYVVWSRVPIIDYAALPDKVRPHVHEDGLWGFTGAPAPAPYFLPLSQCMGVLVELGITPDKIRSVDRGSYEPAGIEVERFVRRQWPEDNWETAWFVNPHVSVFESIHGVSHLINIPLAEAAKYSRFIARSRLCSSQDLMKGRLEVSRRM